MAENNAPVPDHYLCPISLEIMEDPVICSDGITYERREIKRWLQSHNTSPKTNVELASKSLISNFALKSGIDKFLANRNTPATKGTTTQTKKVRNENESCSKFAYFTVSTLNFLDL